MNMKKSKHRKQTANNSWETHNPQNKENMKEETQWAQHKGNKPNAQMRETKCKNGQQTTTMQAIEKKANPKL